ncbi:MAG TPA: TonB-dependent receptor [Terracidiphilus sp.]|nr:TonB-dependent receptor [Terracidiphilus sp.]
MNRSLIFATLFAASALASAQTQSSTLQPAETLVVLGSATPVPLAESPRAVVLLPVEGKLFSLESPADLLRSDSSAFIEQRGAGGGQADIALRGGGFNQTLVLLDGFRINDSQTGHHNLDLPIPLDAMDSIQVLHGAGSTLHGVDALAGVVDFLTAAPAGDSLLLRAGAGNFGENEQSVLGTLARSRWSTRLTADRNLSTGFIPDRDYRNETASSESWLASRLGITDLLFAASDRSFGASQFYGPYPSWERTKGWFAGARQEIGPRTTAAFAWRRHTDEFVLVRSNPALYENNHIDTSWQSDLRHTLPIHASALLFGLEADGDAIDSNNLGRHARNRGAGYVDLDLHPAAARWNLSAGAREEIFSGGPDSAFAPHLAASLRVVPALKLRASGGYGYRIPTYTDLYYSDPTTIGNPNLKPESAWSGDAGLEWVPAHRLTLTATGFYTRQHNTIDYLRASPADQWHAANLSGLRFAGVEAAMTWLPTRAQSVRLSWTALNGVQSALHGLESEYIFNYPVDNLHGAWTIHFPHALTVTNAVELVQRYQQTVYPVWNASFSRASGRVRPYLRFANLSNTGYQEIAGIPMPGRSITGGLALRFGK